MLTIEQKETIINKLIAKHNAARDVVLQLSNSILSAYKKYATGGFDYINKYNTDNIFKTACDNMTRNICGIHYASVTCSSTCGQYIVCYIGNDNPGTTHGVPLAVGWSFGEGGIKMMYSLDEKSILKILGHRCYASISDFVNVNADTNPKVILDFSKKLDMYWKDELTAFVEEVINKWAKGYADAFNEARKIENENDNMLLDEFRMSSVTTKVEVKRFKVTIKEVKNKNNG